jgi:hypothetical protein
MLSNVNISTLHFKTKYITGEAKEVLTDTTKNKYTIKGSTGIGGTTAILNYLLGNYIIISPNIGMIKGKEKLAKEGEFSSHKQLFIYDKCEDSWGDVLDYLMYSDVQNLIINTTPDQIYKIYDSEVYKMLLNIPIFIDEAHAYSQDAIFRRKLGEFMELVYNQWNASFTFSTATPIYNFIDIPNEIPIEYYSLERAKKEPKHIDISNDKKAIEQFVYEQNEQNRLVVIFTNDKNIHLKFKELRVANLVGETLKLKLKPYGRGIELKDLDYDDIDILMLSSSYFAGFDIEQDCSILIVSNQSNDATKVNVNNLVQAYGRCRNEVHDVLFINLLAVRNSKGEVITYPKGLNEIQKSYNDYLNEVKKYESILNDFSLRSEAKKAGYITNANYVNRSLLLNDVLIQINDYQLYNEDVLIQTLEDYGFTTGTYINDIEKVRKKYGSDLKQRMTNLLQLPVDELLNDYKNIKRKLRNKTDGSYSPKLALEYLTAYLMNLTNANVLIDKLDNKRLYSAEFYKSVNAFLCINGSTRSHSRQLSKEELNGSKIYANEDAKDILKSVVWLTDNWQMLYSVAKIGNDNYSDKIAEEICMAQVLYDKETYLKYQSNKKNRISNTRNLITKKLKSEGIPVDDARLKFINNIIKSNFKKLDSHEYINYNSKKNLKKRMKEAIIFLLTNGLSGKGRTTKHREYNPLTLLPRALRSIIPIRYVEVDLTSANPQIIDSILKTDIGLSVYKNLMEKRKINRNEAKTLFNKTLNNYKISVAKAIKIYLDAGYPKAKAKELAMLTAEVEKGAFYERMTMAESNLTKLYKDTLSVKTYRFHDAILMKESDIIDNNITLPTQLERLIDDRNGNQEKVVFHIGYYNLLGVKYEGMVTNKPHSTDKLISSYRMVSDKNAGVKKVAS